MTFLVISDSECNDLEQAHIKIINLESNNILLQNQITELKTNYKKLLKIVNDIVERNETEKQRTKNHTISFLKLRETVSDNKDVITNFTRNSNEITNTIRLFLRSHNNRLNELEFDMNILSEKLNNLNI